MINTAATLIEEDTKLTACKIANILQIAVHTAYHLLTEIFSLSRMCALYSMFFDQWA